MCSRVEETHFTRDLCSGGNTYHCNVTVAVAPDLVLTHEKMRYVGICVWGNTYLGGTHITVTSQWYVLLFPRDSYRYYGHYLHCVQISNIRQKAGHSLILKKEKNFIFLTFFWFSNDKKKEEAEEKPPIVSFGQLVSYRTLLQAEVFNFDHWLNDSPTENSIVNSRNCPDWRACS